MADEKTRAAVAYYRVSTVQQGASGLGLEAQRAAVAAWLAAGGREVTAEFTEVESGRRADRPELAQALAVCREHKAVLVIAKLDRLARNVAFIANLMEGGVEFVAVDMPHASRLTLHILAAVAEHEREMIAERTRAALAAARARGARLGNPRPGEAARAAAVVLRARAAERRARLLPAVREARAGGGGRSYAAAAQALNERGVPTPSGRGQWHATNIHRLLQAVENRQTKTI